MKTISLLLLTVTVICAGAQKPFRFASQNYMGLLEGQQGSALSLQTVNGLVFRSWFAGVGAGLDYYRFRSVPLFLSLNKNFTPQKNALYLSADGGITFPWLKGTPNPWNNTEYKEGLYLATGVGYKIAINNRRQAVLFNAGYSFKHINADREVVSPCLVPPCPVDTEKTDYRLKRLLFRAGFEF